jgi:hypothetical protein
MGKDSAKKVFPRERQTARRTTGTRVDKVSERRHIGDGFAGVCEMSGGPTVCLKYTVEFFNLVLSLKLTKDERVDQVAVSRQL